MPSKEAMAPLLFGDPRCDVAAARTAMRLCDHAAQGRVDPGLLVSLGGINQLVGVVIHLDAALRADHFVGCHSLPPINYSAQCGRGRSAESSPSIRVRPRIYRLA